jgi:hypothetical protein
MASRINVLVALALALCLASLRVEAWDCPEPIGTFPFSEVKGIAVAGDHAFLGGGYGTSPGNFLVADISDLEHPTLIAHIDLPEPALDVQVVGEYAFAAGGDAGLYVIDISDPTSPWLVTTFPIAGWVDDIAVSGQLVFAAASTAGLRIIDVSTPTSPLEIGHLPAPRQFSAVDAAGDHVFVAAGYDGLYSVDVSSPSSPVVVDSHGSWSTATVTVAGDRAYVTGSYSSLRVFDVSQPTNLVYLGGTTEDIGEATNPFIWGDLALTGARIFEISDPAQPRLVASFPVAGPPFQIVVEGDHAFLAVSHGLKDYGAMRIFDLSTISTPDVVGSVNLPFNPMKVALQGSLAFVANGHEGIRVIDVADPSQPVEIGSTSLTASAKDVAFCGGDVLCCANDWSGLALIDASDPSNPIAISSIDTPGSAISVDAKPGFAFVADMSGGLRVIDVADPSTPAEVASMTLPGSAIDVKIVGDLAFVGTGGGLSVIDVSNPLAPTEIGVFGNSNGVMAVDVDGDFAVVVDQTTNRSVRLLDISDPSAPWEVGSIPSYGRPADVSLLNGIVYVGDIDRGLVFFDFSNPSSPLELGFWAGSTLGIARDGDRSYAVGGGSLSIVDAGLVAPAQDISALTFGGVALRVAVRDHFAFVGEQRGRLRVYDHSNPDRPNEAASLEFLGPINDVVVEGDHLYLLDYAGFHVVEITDPAAPAKLASIQLADAALGMSVSGNTAYVADGFDGLRVIDVSVPASPVEIGLVDPGGRSFLDVEADGGLAFVTGVYPAGLYVFDVTTPASPVEIGACSLSQDPLDVVVTGTHAFIASGYGGLRVIDIGDPVSPLEIGALATPGYALGVALFNDTVFLAADSGGVRVIDVTEPTTPVESSFNEGYQSARALAVFGDYLFLAAGTDSFVVFPNCATWVFADDFESGDLGAWSNRID